MHIYKQEITNDKDDDIGCDRNSNKTVTLPPVYELKYQLSTQQLLFSITIEAIVVTIGGIVLGKPNISRAILVMGAMVGRVVRFVMITKAAFVKLAVLADMSWGVTLVAYNTRGFGREIGSRDKSCVHSGKLMIPTRVVDGRSVSRTDGDFDPRGGF